MTLEEFDFVRASTLTMPPRDGCRSRAIHSTSDDSTLSSCPLDLGLPREGCWKSRVGVGSNHNQHSKQRLGGRFDFRCICFVSSFRAL